MKKILTSECLYGGRTVRYDAGDCTETNPVYLKWKEEGRLVTVCPEVFGGLPTPRPDSQRVGDKVIACTGPDVTAEYTKGAEEALRLAKEHDVAFNSKSLSGYPGICKGSVINEFASAGRAVLLHNAESNIMFFSTS